MAPCIASKWETPAANACVVSLKPWLHIIAIRLRYDDTTTHSTTTEVIEITMRLRYDYNPTTTYRARLLTSDAIRREQKMNVSVFRRSHVVVVSQSNRTQIVISITSVVVECVVVSSSYRSRIAIGLSCSSVKAGVWLKERDIETVISTRCYLFICNLLSEAAVLHLATVRQLIPSSGASDVNRATSNTAKANYLGGKTKAKAEA